MKKSAIDLSNMKSDYESKVISLFHIQKKIRSAEEIDFNRGRCNVLRSDGGGFSMDFKSFFEYYCKICINKSENEKFTTFDIAKKFLTLKLDLTHYLKMIDQMDRIKLLIMKPYQIFMLDNQKKVNLLSAQEKMTLEMMNNEKLSGDNENQMQLVQFILQKIKERSFDHIDNLLYENLDKKMKKFINDLSNIENDDKSNNLKLSIKK